MTWLLIVLRVVWIVWILSYLLKLVWKPLDNATAFGKLQQEGVSGWISTGTLFTSIYALAIIWNVAIVTSIKV